MSEEQDESGLSNSERLELRKNAALNVTRLREAHAISETAATGDALDAIMRMAEKATGLTREELAAMPSEPPPAFVEAVADPKVKARKRAESANVPERHIRHTVDADPVDCDALAKVQSFGSEGVLVLSGGVGTRKTGSACWALAQADGGVFVKAKHLLKIDIEDKALALRLSRARLVVLDDLGTELPDEKGYWLSTFNDFLDDWYANCAKVIITANITPDQFKQRYGIRTYDRMRESGEWFDVAGESVRGK